MSSNQLPTGIIATQIKCWLPTKEARVTVERSSLDVTNILASWPEGSFSFVADIDYSGSLDDAVKILKPVVEFELHRLKPLN